MLKDNKQDDFEVEQQRLEQTIVLAKKQLSHLQKRSEDKKEEILVAKKELRENTEHAIGNLWSSDAFEALAEMSQYSNPIEEKIIDYEEMDRKMRLLEAMLQSPYFARIDFKFEEEDSFEKIYIGKTSLKESDSHEMMIYDWRSPIASIFYRFVMGEVYYDAPAGRIHGEVNLKRQYEINQGVLEYFFDADVQIVDEFLRQLLSQNTSTKMKTIVETIQKEQDIVIRDMENELMMVQGVAGSGKTSIALHRVAYLMYQGLSNRLAANNIIIISPNALFEQYISNVLPELGESNVESVVFEEILKTILHRKSIQSRNQFLETLLTSSHYRIMMKRSIEFKTSSQFLEVLNRFLEDIPRRWIAFEDVHFEGKCVIRKETLKDKVIGKLNAPLNERLTQLEEYVVEFIKRMKKGRLKKLEEMIIRKELQRYTELNIFELYQRIFDDPEYFFYLAGEGASGEQWKDILDYTKENLGGSLLFYDDAIAIAYLKLKIFGTEEYKGIKQVVIDEAQDYYPLQLELFRMLFPNAKFTILGDMNQTLEKKENISFYDQVRTILNKKKSSLAIMDKSFRCTNEILLYSMKFLRDSHEIKSFNRQGDKPQVFSAKDKDELREMIQNEVTRCKEKGYKTIGLICKTQRNVYTLYELLKDTTELQLIQQESSSDFKGVLIIPIYMSKGLEFDAVLVCDATEENYQSEEDKNLLYIASTRALHRLSLFGEGRVSPLL